MQIIFCFGYLKINEKDLALANWQFYLLVLSTVCIAAGGYIINNIFDQDTDLINDPKKVIVGTKISESMAYNFYVGFTIIGVALGFYLSNVIQRPGFSVVFILIATLLYFYATTLKQIAIVGNIVVSVLLAFSIIIVGVFEIFPATDDANREHMKLLFSILIDYSIIAFIINFIREIIKDCEDFEGDFNEGLKTLPIIFGKEKTSKLVAILVLIPIVLIIIYINNYLMNNDLYYISAYLLLLIIGPLFYVLVKSISAKNKSDFKHLSLILKFVILFGIFSILTLSFNINLNHVK